MLAGAQLKRERVAIRIESGRVVQKHLPYGTSVNRRGREHRRAIPAQRIIKRDAGAYPMFRHDLLI
ncbi:hypothetical protein GCM10011495_05750 [Hymenobacter frigidus]|uniref:Uncharacterized protein n=1 Tax=Hymenobacter frigidus TaxID=1524095 RepID=A0ABQ1ZYP1_9BACT|nr:hypothetical protein GCM10011495_05750 [Hymenobacter frigidus]